MPNNQPPPPPSQATSSASPQAKPQPTPASGAPSANGGSVPDGGSGSGSQSSGEAGKDDHNEVVVGAIAADPTVVDDVEELEEACRAFGAHLVVQRMGLRGERGVHDPLRLGAAFSDLFA